VLVIDNGSTDATDAVAKKCWPTSHPVPLRVVAEPRLGLHHARRCAFQQSHYDIVSLVDDDNWVCDNWVQSVAEVMARHPEAGACGGPTRPAYESMPPAWMGDLIRNLAVGDQAQAEGDVTDSPGRLWGAGISVRRLAWDSILPDGLDFFLTDRSGKELTSGGDSELCYRLRLAGWKLYYSTRMSLQHYMPDGRLRWEYLERLYTAFGRSQVILDMYERQLRDTGRDHPRAKLMWVKALGMSSRAAKLLPKLAGRREGNEDLLRFRFCQGYLRQLWGCRSQYQLLDVKIQALALLLRSVAEQR
jgi:glycosyltransferase involved in cell wall biosynthesis